jgi:hypothetical protein
MVRPVEPDPPQPLPRMPGGVRGATATPEQLGQTPVQEREDRSGRRKPKPGAQTETGDTVSLEQGQSESGTPDRPEGRTDPGPTPKPPQRHLDVKG